ncbi:MAG: amidohydrolase family protein [Acidobacteria bacterium]|nr:amidohydrolase family protein [Acidobacteriota bacterium]
MHFVNSARTLPVLLFGLVCLSFTLKAQTSSAHQELITYPELIIYNGKVVSMDDPEINSNVGTVAEAIVVRDGKVWKLGTSDEMLRYAGPETTRIDVKERTVIPGMIAVHYHLHNSGLNTWLDRNPQVASEIVRRHRVSSDADTLEKIEQEIRVILAERMGGVRPGQWTFIYLPTVLEGYTAGGGALGFDFLRQTIMKSIDIDEYSGSDKPVILAAHPAYLINTAAKEWLMETYDGSYGENPAIGSGGVPHEAWSEAGYAEMGTEYRRSVVVDGYFADKTDELADVIHGAMEELAASGQTTFSSHVIGVQNMDAYMRLMREERMPVRFGFTHYTGFSVTESAEGFYRRLGDLFQLGNDYLWFNGIALGMLDHGPPLFCSSMVPEEDYQYYRWCRYEKEAPNYKTIVTALKNGNRVQPGHNYADMSADYFMDAIEEAMDSSPEITLEYIRSLRLSFDHCGLYPRPDQLPRIKHLGMYLACYTSSLSRSEPWLDKWGFEEHENWVAPIKSALAAGVKVAWEGSGPRNAFPSLVPFITRVNSNGRVIAPDQAVDRETVMKMATTWASEFMLIEDKVGSLEPGKLADIVVLSQDWFRAPIEELDRTHALMTVVGGKIITLREDFARELGRQPIGFQIRYAWETEFDAGN